MTVKEQKREIMIEKRARALAMMLLTRRDDLQIEEVEGDIGLDYIVRFYSDGKEGLREFGVLLRGALTAATKGQADETLRPAIQKMKGYGPFFRPVCLFYFTMENDGAWYAWVAEPVEAEEGKPMLRSRAEPDCKPLDKKALKEIIERVDWWYDAIFPSLIANGPGGRKGERKGAKE